MGREEKKTAAERRKDKRAGEVFGGNLIDLMQGPPPKPANQQAKHKFKAETPKKRSSRLGRLFHLMLNAEC